MAVAKLAHHWSLNVISPYNNPMRWKSRLANFRRFEDAILGSDISLTTVELAYGEAPFDLPDREGVRRMRYRTNDVLWHKENLINLAERRLQYDYAAYVDGDLLFWGSDWALKTFHALQVYPLVQISTSLVNLGPPPDEEAKSAVPSFMSVHFSDYDSHRTEWFDNGLPVSATRHGYPGGAWAWRKAAWHEMGGLPERCILGSADYHAAFAVVDMPGDPVIENRDYSEGYRSYIADWRRQAFSAIKGHVGIVPGTMHHLWHGRMEDRQYETRPRVLVRNRYDPHFDVRSRHDGILEFAGNKPMLRRDLLAYFRSRNEDTIEATPARRHPHPPPHPPHPPRPPHPPYRR